MNKEGFKNYLIKKGYKETTPGGKPSTVYDYLSRIEKISKVYSKNIYSINDWTLLEKIKKELDTGGENEYLGSQSHRAVFNAMARYCKFIKEQN